MKLDIRQDTSLHIQAFDEICEFVGVVKDWKLQRNSGDIDDSKVKYSQLDESERCDLLSDLLNSRRPVVPRRAFPVSEISQEVLKTFSLLSKLEAESLGAYVVSMASRPSDVLLVELLQREYMDSLQKQKPLRVVPLLETIEALRVRLLQNKCDVCICCPVWFADVGRHYALPV